jgi:hypothetical protein
VLPVATGVVVRNWNEFIIFCAMGRYVLYPSDWAKNEMVYARFPASLAVNTFMALSLIGPVLGKFPVYSYTIDLAGIGTDIFPILTGLSVWTR